MRFEPPPYTARSRADLPLVMMVATRVSDRSSILLYSGPLP
jgi:hypothetical protein